MKTVIVQIYHIHFDNDPMVRISYNDVLPEQNKRIVRKDIYVNQEQFNNILDRHFKSKIQDDIIHLSKFYNNEKKKK